MLQRFRARGPLLVVTLIIASTAMIASGVAAGPEGEPSQAEVESFATDEGISEDEARERLRDQAKLPALARNARRELGSHYGGVWVDARGDGRIKLGVPAPDRRLRRAAARAAAQAGLEGRVDLVAVARSDAQLRDLQRSLDRELRVVNCGAADPIDAVPDAERGVVEILTPSRADRTAAQRRFLTEAPRRYGDAIRIRRGPGRLKLDERG